MWEGITFSPQLYVAGLSSLSPPQAERNSLTERCEVCRKVLAACELPYDKHSIAPFTLDITAEGSGAWYHVFRVIDDEQNEGPGDFFRNFFGLKYSKNMLYYSLCVFQLPGGG